MDSEKRVHIPILWLLLPLIAGIAWAGTADRLTPLWWLIPAGLLLVSNALTLKSAPPWTVPAWSMTYPVIGFLSGVVLFSVRDDHPARWNGLPDRELGSGLEIVRTFTPSDGGEPWSGIGIIRDAPPHLADLNGQKVNFRLRRGQPEGLLIRGSILKTTGILSARPPVSDDSFDRYLQDSGVHFELSRVAIDGVGQEPGFFRRLTEETAARLESALRRGVASDNSLTGIYVAMMLGRKSELNPGQKDLFVQSGTLHLFAISGLHIGVIALTLYSLLGFMRIPKRAGAIIGLAGLFLFVDATGASPSAVRAFAMTAFFWAARVFQRPGSPASALCLSALVILLMDPHQLFSVSFQLSYGVVLSLLLLGLPLGRALSARWNPHALIPPEEQTWWSRQSTAIIHGLLATLAISLAATLVSTPISIANFGIWAPGAVFGNILLIPTASLVIMAGSGSMLAGLVGLSFLSVVFNHAALVVLWLMDAIIRVGLLVPGLFWETELRAQWLGPGMLIALITLILTGYSIGWKRLPGGFFSPFAALGVFLILGVTFQPGSRRSAIMKSAYELAMERLDAKGDPEDSPLTEEQKKRLAEIDTVFKGKIAEREIFLTSTLAEAKLARKWEEVELIQKQIQSERSRLEEEREARKEKVRREKA